MQSQRDGVQPSSRMYKNILVSTILLILSCLYAVSASLSKDNQGEFPYNTTTVPLLAEALKALVSGILLLLELRKVKEPSDRYARIHWTPTSVATAAVPGFAYQMLNNLNFVTLYYLDAATFQILGNLKIIATGLAGFWLMGRQLSVGKWCALVLLSIGAGVTQLGRAVDDAGGGGAILGYISALACVTLSATVGVFTEKYMKSNTQSIHWQNLQLYIFGILANLGALHWTGNTLFFQEENSSGPFKGFNLGAVFCVLALSMSGLAVSFLLRFADSIVKTYATALSAPFAALAARMLIGTPIGFEHILGLGVMLISLVFYYGGEELFLDARYKLNQEPV